ncbi:glycerol-3-phosphate dehydrogenase/oxidase [Ammoniphilus resinae]|nr:glycerol-3-phosphate dehydrogenase/oxidase [Ammoniphilus resinae]
MSDTSFDLLVIGGGITGAGIALDAATRGMKTALVEMQDFAGGTSSRSTKLIHGGLRYLKQGEFKQVAEVGRERAIVYKNGPHVTKPEWMLLPIYQGGTLGRWGTSFGLWLYDRLAGVKRSERRKMLTVAEVLEKEPLLNKTGLLCGGYYVEYRTDDARLTLEVTKKAVAKGVLAVNYTEVESFVYNKELIAGVRVKDQLSKQEYVIPANKVVNAAGPWVDLVREKDGSRKKTIQWTKGIHLVFDQRRFPLRQAIYFDTFDGRMVFAIPRDGKTYVGTTDTIFHGDPMHPRMEVEDRVYLLGAISGTFPGLYITEKDIESSWAGIRPLIAQAGKKPSEISRKDEIWHSSSGLLTVAGGKLTGYRKMAEMVVDRIPGNWGPCQTRQMPISGGEVGRADNFLHYVEETAKASSFSLQWAKQIVCQYGSNAKTIFSLARELAKNKEDLGLPIELLAILEYSIREEMAVTPADFFVRRTGALYFRRKWVEEWKQPVISYMAKRFDWSLKEKIKHLTDLNQHLQETILAVGEES